MHAGGNYSSARLSSQLSTQVEMSKELESRRRKALARSLYNCQKATTTSSVRKFQCDSLMPCFAPLSLSLMAWLPAKSDQRTLRANYRDEKCYFVTLIKIRNLQKSITTFSFCFDIQDN
jgi:hypothetical protein